MDTTTAQKTIKYPVNARKGKERIRKCMDNYLQFISEIERQLQKGKGWFSEEIVTSLIDLIVSVVKFTDGIHSKPNVQLAEDLDKFGTFSEIKLSINNNLLLIKDEDLIFILKLMQIFKIEGFYKENHFLFIRENRNIETTIHHDVVGREMEGDDLSLIDDTWIPEKFLYEVAKESINSGYAELAIKENIKLIAIHDVFLILKPCSEFGRRLLSKDGIPVDIFNKYYKVIYLDYRKLNTLIELVKSIFATYYIIIGEFYSILVCDECNSLYFRKKEYADNDENQPLTCSGVCYKQIWKRKNPLASARDDCFNNQREWVKLSLYLSQIDETSNICKDCPMDLLVNKISRGDCPLLWNIYGERIEKKFIQNNGYSYQANLCRKRQNKWLSNKLNKIINTKKEFCKSCPLQVFPDAGECPSLCKKYGDQLAKVAK